MEDPGLAVTLDPVLKFKLEEGTQLKIVAPEAVSVVELPIQIVALDVEMVGMGFTTTVTGEELLQPNCVPVTVYVVVEAGVAVTNCPELAFKVAAGAQV